MFKKGLQPITHLSFEDTLAVSQTIVGRFEGDLAEDVVAAGIEAFVTPLKALNEEFAEELRKYDSKEIEFKTLEAARTRGNLFIRQIIAKVLGEYNQMTEEDAETRETVLKPLMEQVERVRQARKNRRTLQEIDPETGEEIETETPPALQPEPTETQEVEAALN